MSNQFFGLLGENERERILPLSGITWSVHTSPTTANLNAVEEIPLHFLAVGDGGVIVRAASGNFNLWNIIPSGVTERLNACSSSTQPTPLIDRSIVVGDNGRILTSDDRGMTWTIRSSPTTLNLNAVFAHPLYSIAVGNGGIILRSVDFGVTWNIVTSPTTANLLFLRPTRLFNPPNLLAGGENNILIQAPLDGLNWVRNFLPDLSTVLRGSVALVRDGGMQNIVIGQNGIFYRSNTNGVVFVAGNNLQLSNSQIAVVDSTQRVGDNRTVIVGRDRGLPVSYSTFSTNTQFLQDDWRRDIIVGSSSLRALTPTHETNFPILGVGENGVIMSSI